MSKIKARVIDRNRYSKKYPLVRAPKRLSYMGDPNLELEVITVSFDNQDFKDVNFEMQYADTNFRVLVSPRDTTDSDSAQVTLAVDDDYTDTSKVRIISSAPFTGDVDIIVIRVT